jgi:hypothetical protein
MVLFGSGVDPGELAAAPAPALVLVLVLERALAMGAWRGVVRCGMAGEWP